MDASCSCRKARVSGSVSSWTAIDRRSSRLVLRSARNSDLRRWPWYTSASANVIPARPCSQLDLKPAIASTIARVAQTTRNTTSALMRSIEASRRSSSGRIPHSSMRLIVRTGRDVAEASECSTTAASQQQLREIVGEGADEKGSETERDPDSDATRCVDQRMWFEFGSTSGIPSKSARAKPRVAHDDLVSRFAGPRQQVPKEGHLSATIPPSELKGPALSWVARGAQIRLPPAGLASRGHSRRSGEDGRLRPPAAGAAASEASRP